MVGQTATILNLAVELHDNIVACLDIKDILSLSLTCKYFHTIMESRQTWMKFVQKTQLQLHISKIEEPLEDYKTEELRDWVLRRHKIHHCLHSGSRATCHRIRGTDNAKESVLLPGGRWLLLGNSPGNISYTDCDATVPETRLLISFEDAVPNHIRTQFVVWRDPHSPRLTFRVAILYWYNRENRGRGYQAHFCKIDLVGHGSSARLVAERLHQYEGCIPKTEASIEGIRGEYFYQMHHYQFYGISSRFTAIWASLEILDYGDGSSVAKQVLLDDFYYQLPEWRFSVLPDGRIAVSASAAVVIYPDPLPIIGNKMTTLTPSLVPRGAVYTSRGQRENMSEWYSGPDSNMAVYGAPDKKMIAICIPHDGAPPMNRTIEALAPNNIVRCILGQFHGVTMISRGCIGIFSYPWGDFRSQRDSGEMTRRMFDIERGRDDDTHDVGIGAVDALYFDEEFGRVIIRDRHSRYFVVDVVAT